MTAACCTFSTGPRGGHLQLARALLLKEEADEPPRDGRGRELEHGFALEREPDLLVIRAVGFHDDLERLVHRGVLAARFRHQHRARFRRDDRRGDGAREPRVRRLAFAASATARARRSSRCSRSVSASTRPFFNAAFGVERLAAEDEVERRGQADEPRQPRGAAPRREDAELGFGQADFRALVGRGDAPIARERDLVSAADARAVNGGDGRDRQRGDARDRLLAEVDEDAQLLGVHALDALEIRAGDEDRRLGADDDERLRAEVRLGDRLEMRVELLERLQVEDVHRRLRPVESEDAGAVFAKLALDGLHGGQRKVSWHGRPARGASGRPAR